MVSHQRRHHAFAAAISKQHKQNGLRFRNELKVSILGSNIGNLGWQCSKKLIPVVKDRNATFVCTIAYRSNKSCASLSVKKPRVIPSGYDVSCKPNVLIWSSGFQTRFSSSRSTCRAVTLRRFCAIPWPLPLSSEVHCEFSVSLLPELSSWMACQQSNSGMSISCTFVKLCILCGVSVKLSW